VVGAGPNGLAAAIVLAQAGFQVTVYEAAGTAGGALRSRSLLSPDSVTDLGAASHPFGVASPFFNSLDLQRHGLEWIDPAVPLAHPLIGRPAALLHRSLERTTQELDRDGGAWNRLHRNATDHWPEVVESVLAPLLRVPRRPLTLAGFGARGAWPAASLARAAFRGEEARALFGGSAAHSWLPLTRPLTAAFGVLFGAAAHASGWPVARGGSQRIADALVAELTDLGGELVLDAPVEDLGELGPADLVLLDVTPRQFLRMSGGKLPPRYARALGRYRYGAAAHKVDYLLDGPVPWSDPRVQDAGTVHVVGGLDDIVRAEREVHAGTASERPFVLLGQQSRHDRSRAPRGQEVVWAYAHVPSGNDGSAGHLVDRQIERFAPGFRDRVLARVETTPQQFERWNANLVGGDINGGSMDGLQQLLRPVARADPYSTPLPGVYLCSSSTPPGGGAHGMCGYHAARAALRWQAATSHRRRT